MPMCLDYKSDKTKSKILGTSIAFIIIAINTVLRKVIIALITNIQLDTYSAELAAITNGVFIAQFMNSGLLLLMVNANLEEHHSWIFPTQAFRGPYHDYEPRWYADIGQKIFQTMIINSIMPYVGLLVGFVIPKIKQSLDNGFTGNRWKTKKHSMAQYCAIYYGPDYIIHFKYAGVLNVVYITCMYGIGMPMLFPLAALNFFNQWVCERLIVAYFVRLPPALDDALTLNCVEKLKYAPLLFLANGYWMLSNRQMFENKAFDIDYTFNTMRSGHAFGADLKDSAEINWAFPALFITMAALSIIGLQKVLGEYLTKWGFTLQTNAIAVDEDLPNFFESIKLSQADELIAENDNMRNNFGFTPNDPDTIHVLDHCKVPKLAMQGTPWYQIMSNGIYAQKFQYIGANINERECLIEDGFKDYGDDRKEEQKHIRYEQSDMVMILMNIAYLPDDIITADDFNFKPGW